MSRLPTSNESLRIAKAITGGSRSDRPDPDQPTRRDSEHAAQSRAEAVVDELAGIREAVGSLPPFGAVILSPIRPSTDYIRADGATYDRVDLAGLYQWANNNTLIKREASKLAHEYGDGNGTTKFSLPVYPTVTGLISWIRVI